MVKQEIQVLEFQPFDPGYIKRVWTKEILIEKMYGVVGEARIDQMVEGGLEKQVKGHCEQMKKAGVKTFELTARHRRWLEASSYVPDYMNKAVGTHANILTVYEAIVKGRVPVNVAAHALNPLEKGKRFLHPHYQTGELVRLMEECSAYIRKHLPKFAKILKLNPDEEEKLKRYPLMMDPIDFANAHNAILIPGGETPTEHYDIIQRGALYGVKAYPWWKQTPEQWGAQFAALSDMLKEPMIVCATGKIGPKNVVATLETPYVRTIGGSSLIGATPEETYAKSKEMVTLVATTKKAK